MSETAVKVTANFGRSALIPVIAMAGVSWYTMFDPDFRQEEPSGANALKATAYGVAAGVFTTFVPESLALFGAAWLARGLQRAYFKKPRFTGGGGTGTATGNVSSLYMSEN
jgi:hypothetical protein